MHRKLRTRKSLAKNGWTSADLKDGVREVFFLGDKMFDAEQLKKQILKTDLKTAQYKMIHAGSTLRPSRQLPINVVRDGGKWVCVFESDPDPLSKQHRILICCGMVLQDS